METLLDPMCRDTGADEDVERDTAEAMRHSLPILRGETSKISKQLQRFDEELSEVARGARSADMGVDDSQPDPGGQTAEPSQYELAAVTREDSNLDTRDEFGLRVCEAERLDSDSEDDSPAVQTSGLKDSRINHSARILDNNNNNSNNSNNNNSLTAARSNSLYGFGSQYKKGTDSWIKSASPPSDGPADERNRPKQLIPVVSKDTPLAKRHSYMISQCKCCVFHEVRER